MKTLVATCLLATSVVLAACSGGSEANSVRPADPYDAAAGEPVRCTGRATVANDPIGDILTYDVGIAPRPALDLASELAGVDITRSAVRIDGRTLCAVVTLASPPELDFELTLSLKDTTTMYCCAALTFRSLAGRLEVGVPRFHLLDRLVRVRDAGAELRGDTLEFSGTLDEAEWHPRPPRSADDLVWRIETHTSPEELEPGYGDWLPPWKSIDQRYVRHRDGEAVLGPRG